MPEQQSVRFNVPKGGFAPDLTIREMGADYSPNLTNCFFENQKELKRRLCQTPYIVAAFVDGGSADHMFEHRGFTGTSKIFAHTDANSIYENVAGTWTSRDTSFTSRIRTAKLGNLVVMGDGVNPAKTYNGTAFAAVTTGPAAPFASYIGNIFHSHKGRMFAAGDPARGMDVIHSATIGGGGSGADYWSTVLSGVNQGGFIDVAADIPDGDIVTGITSYLGYLVVFTNNYIVYYTTEETATGFDAAVHKVVGGEGCVSQDTIQSIGNDVAFLSPNGYKTLSQVLVQGDAGVNSSGLVLNAYVTDLLRTSVTVANIRSTFIPKYGLYICNLGTEQHVFQFAYKAWFKWTGLDAQLFRDSLGVAYTAGTTVQTLDDSVTSDTKGAVNTAVSYIRETAPVRTSGQELKNRFIRAELICICDPDESVLFEYWVNDDETNTKVSETIVLNAGGAGRAAVDLRIPIIGRGEFITMRTTNSNDTDYRETATELYYVAGGMR